MICGSSAVQAPPSASCGSLTLTLILTLTFTLAAGPKLGGPV